MNFHLAQVNIAIARYTREDPLSVNDDAEATFGEPDLISTCLFGKRRKHLATSRTRVITLMSCASAPTGSFRRTGRYWPLWWQNAGTIRTRLEARYRLDLLAQSGPTQDAFTFGSFFEAPAQKEAARG